MAEPDKGVHDWQAHRIADLYGEFVKVREMYKKRILKRLPRNALDNPYGTVVLCMLISDSFFPLLDREKVLKMAISYTFKNVFGDILPSAQTPDDLEPELFVGLPSGLHYKQLVEEYEKQSSREARFVRLVQQLEKSLANCKTDSDRRNRVDDLLHTVRTKTTLLELDELLTRLKKSDT